MSKTTILVVDDEAPVRRLLRDVFLEGGYAVVEAHDRNSALKAVKESAPDLVTLDLQLGGDEGLEVAREIRNISSVPIIMVTARGDVVDRVVGLEIGADDYVTKPFHVREVLARVRSVLRRSRSRNEAPIAEVFEFDGMTAIPSHRELSGRSGEQISLSDQQFRLLNAFLENPNRALSRDRLMDLVNGSDWTPLDRTIDNQVARLRKQIEVDASHPKLIKTVRGTGYVLACEVKRRRA